MAPIALFSAGSTAVDLSPARRSSDPQRNGPSAAVRRSGALEDVADECAPEPANGMRSEDGEEDDESPDSNAGSHDASPFQNAFVPPRRRYQYPPPPRRSTYGGNVPGDWLSSQSVWSRLSSPLSAPHLSKSSAVRPVARRTNPPVPYVLKHHQGSLTIFVSLVALIISLSLAGWMMNVAHRSGMGERDGEKVTTSVDMPGSFDRSKLAQACQNLEESIYRRLSDKIRTDLSTARASANCLSNSQERTFHWTGEAEPQIQFDYALASLGARVLSTRKTRPLIYYRALFLGLPLYEDSDKEDMADAPLQPLVIPGRCWRFQEFPGELVISLAEKVIVTSFSLSHIRSANVPASRLRSAPQNFEVWALQSEYDIEGHLLGSYVYEADTGGNPSLQQPEQLFQVAPQNVLPAPAGIVLLKVLSNHGSLDYTCVYRFKVFGTPAAPVST